MNALISNALMFNDMTNNYQSKLIKQPGTRQNMLNCAKLMTSREVINAPIEGRPNQ